jgi:hypothetical protein
MVQDRKRHVHARRYTVPGNGADAKCIPLPIASGRRPLRVYPGKPCHSGSYLDKRMGNGKAPNGAGRVKMSLHKTTAVDYLGSVSSGTMRPEDLIPAFLSVCDGIRLSSEDRAKVSEKARESAKEGYYETEQPCHDLTELWDILNSYSPPFFYFDSHPGDGADYGFWLSEDSLRDAIRDGEVWEDKDNGGKMPRAARYRLTVSDHGNMSLYHRNGRPVWEIV